MQKTINITLKIEGSQLTAFDASLRQQFEVIDLKILPDTEALYMNDDYFKKLVKGVKDAQLLRDRYINEKNFNK